MRQGENAEAEIARVLLLHSELCSRAWSGLFLIALASAPCPMRLNASMMTPQVTPWETSIVSVRSIYPFSPAWDWAT